MAYHFLCSSQYEEAISWCRRALELSPRDVFSLANLGASLLGIGSVPEARSVLTQALELAPDHPPALYSMGTLVLENDSPEQAVAFLKRAVAGDPNNGDFWNHLGIALLMSGHPGSEECFHQALRADPDHYAASLNLEALRRKDSSPIPDNGDVMHVEGVTGRSAGLHPT